jgi:hypothetical protein
LRHPATLEQLRFTADGRQLLSFGRGKLRRWYAKTGAALPGPVRVITPGYSSGMLTPDAARAIVPYVEKHNRLFIREYDLATDRFETLFHLALPEPREGEPPAVWNSRFELSPDGTLLLQGFREQRPFGTSKLGPCGSAWCCPGSGGARTSSSSRPTGNTS